ncbi:hypothetical protein TNCV_1830651 [Trichonephila clavipes]|nr:hypothetical protein TNCV_1830651 [Trichonephila clavipes]
MAVNDRTASSRQLAARWSTATGVLMSASSIRRRLLHRGVRLRGTHSFMMMSLISNKNDEHRLFLMSPIDKNVHRLQQPPDLPKIICDIQKFKYVTRNYLQTHY